MHNDPWSPGCLCPSLLLFLQDENDAAASASSVPLLRLELQCL